MLLTAHKNPVVVIGGTENALGVIRDFGRRGIPGYSIVDYPDASVTSKYCHKYYALPGVTSEPHKLHHVLRQLMDELPGRSVLFPTSDLAVAAVARILPSLTKQYCAPISSSQTVETLLIKTQFYRSVRTHGIPHPYTLVPEEPGFDQALRGLDFPVIVKPAQSQLMMQRLGRKGFIARSPSEVDRYLRLTHRHGIDVVIQEVIPGPPSNNYALDGYFDRHHNLIAFFPRQVLRIWPLFFGNSSACTSRPVTEVKQWKSAITRYLHALQYRGVFNAHYKVDARDQVGKLLEINARSVGGGGVTNTFPTFCGIDLLLAAYQDALEQDCMVRETYQSGLHVLNSQNELCWILAMLIQRRFSLRPYLATIQGPKHWTLWAWDDWKPFIASYAQRLTHIRALFRRVHAPRG